MVALVTTMHDPDGRMVEATRRLFPRLLRIYEAITVAPTALTSIGTLEELRGAMVEPLAAGNDSIGAGRRHALRMGLQTAASHLHYCDFDRILHWIGRYPEELATVLKGIRRYDYLLIGRTDRAFDTHPRVQRNTETITNHAFSLWFGREVDISAGSCGVSRRASELLLARSVAPTNATDAEWPALVHLAPFMTVGDVRTEGLEFETPDYYREEIARIGSLGAWLEERSRPLAGWISRTRLTLESLESVAAVERERG